MRDTTNIGKYEMILMFSITLPLGALYWFGLTFMQILAQLAVIHATLVPIDMLGYFITIIPILMLDFLMMREKKSEKQRLLLEGFLLSAVLQPIIFAIWWYYSVYH